MLKMYHKRNHAGNTPELWEEFWRGEHFENTVKFCDVDPMRSLFEKYSQPGSLMLEGGCGLGNYVAYYNTRGWRVIGLDFAQEALNALHLRQKNVNLCGGDVSKLPFADETFDLYYSGGVVEHFEEGAKESLLEARRVLKKDGILLISVPYQSPLRSLLTPLKKSEWKRVATTKPDETRPANGLTFFQYVYKKKEFEKMLTDAGLKVIKTQGYGIIWGLYELPFFNQNKTLHENPINGKNTVANQITEVDVKQLIDPNNKSSILKRLVVSEDETVPVLGLGVKFMRWVCSNMMMYVCRKSI
jgi:ubiquinone/menaquinone biosynthesis C-methylase UbiE